jgi:hypothetical protein
MITKLLEFKYVWNELEQLVYKNQIEPFRFPELLQWRAENVWPLITRWHSISHYPVKKIGSDHNQRKWLSYSASVLIRKSSWIVIKYLFLMLKMENICSYVINQSNSNLLGHTLRYVLHSLYEFHPYPYSLSFSPLFFLEISLFLHHLVCAVCCGKSDSCLLSSW